LSGWHGTLTLHVYRRGFSTDGAQLISYDVERGVAHFGPVELFDSRHVVVWDLVPGEFHDPDALLCHAVVLDDATDWIVRCDRIDFPAGGIAYTHTHPGPGIRYQLEGSIRIESEGRVTEYGTGEAWFESGPDPVHATGAPDRPSAFVRVLVLPAEWQGKRTIRYVDAADEDRPKLQRPTVFFDRALDLPR
jgi:quercetin dioxygenase-like cupin family protein